MVWLLLLFVRISIVFFAANATAAAAPSSAVEVAAPPSSPRMQIAPKLHDGDMAGTTLGPRRTTRCSHGMCCSALSAAALSVSWKCIPSTDLYWVAIFGSSADANTSRPAAIVTTKVCSAVVDDLVANQTYWLRVRSHPASAPSTVWGWRHYEQAMTVRCTTLDAPLLTLERQGDLASDTVSVRWQVDGNGYEAGSDRSTTVHTLRWRRHHHHHDLRRSMVSGHSTSVWDGSVAIAPAVAVTNHTNGGVARLDGLASGASYIVVLEQSINGVVTSISDPLRVKTATAGLEYLTVYRVSEETTDIDLLMNHNAGDLVGEAAFLTDSGNFVMPPQQLSKDSCAQALNRTECRPLRQSSLRARSRSKQDCMQCVADEWAHGKGVAADAVRAECSDPSLPFPTDNKVMKMPLRFCVCHGT